ncbi:MAG TPA: nucleoside phosphorylase, partial [Vicinamibacteria bacterium]|nr:nucleoside phosphorylase [Vicinamibacteria bacterium]
MDRILAAGAGRPIMRQRPGRRGRQYHLGVGRGDVASNVILVGDPARAEIVAGRFEKRRGEWRHREFVTISGVYHGLDVTVTGTGIGPDNMEIAVIELSQCRKDMTLIRVGSCGALQRGVRLGDLVVSTAAVRLENTTSFFVPEGFPAVASFEVTQALVEACGRTRARHHVGITASAPGFYGAQSRHAPGFPPRFADLPGDLGRLGVLNFEMEISALFTLAGLGGHRAGAVCAVYAQRPRRLFANARQRKQGEARAIEA